MSVFSYLFDNEFRQRNDIDSTKLATQTLESGVDGLWTEVGQLKDTTRELTATIHVLVEILGERGGVDLADFKTRLDAALHPPHRSRRDGRAPRAGGVVAPAVEVHCVRCNVEGMSDALIKVGADYFCRSCAANP